MGNVELLIKLKRLYEGVQDVLENAEFRGFEYQNALQEQLDNIKDMYETIHENTDAFNLKTGIHCRDCGEELLISDIIDYEFVCIECDENYSIDEAKVDENVEEHWYNENSYFIKSM